MSESFRVIRCVPFTYGEHRVRMGEWRRMMDQFGRMVGYQAVTAKQDSTRESDASPAALGAREIRINAGLMGRSRTAGLKEPERVGRQNPRTGRLRPEEDQIECVIELVKCYPESANYRDIDLLLNGKLGRGLAPGGDRAVRVYPRAAVPVGVC